MTFLYLLSHVVAMNGITQPPTPSQFPFQSSNIREHFHEKPEVHRVTVPVRTGYALLLTPVDFTLAVQAVTLRLLLGS